MNKIITAQTNTKWIIIEFSYRKDRTQVLLDVINKRQSVCRRPAVMMGNVWMCHSELTLNIQGDI